MKQNLRFIFLTLLCAVFSTAWGETSTLTFTAACGGSGTADDGVEWAVYSDAAESQFDSSRGIHYGTGSKPVSYLTLETSGISGTITKIVVNASGASNTEAKLNVTVGGEAFGSQQSLSSSATNYTFEGEASGKIVVDLTQTSVSKALYVKSIAVTYTSGTTPSGPVDPTVTVPSDPVTVYVGQTIDNPVSIPSDLTTVTYSSNPEGVVTLDASGNVTGVAVGDAEITVSWAAVTDKYNAGSKSYFVNVTEAPEATVYEKVTDANQLVAGNQYILVGSNSSKTAAMGKQIIGSNTNYRDAVEISFTEGKVNITDQEVAILTLGSNETGWTFKASDNEQYLIWKSGNSIDSQTDPSNWTVNSDDNGFYLCFATTPERILQYNSGSTRFACYTGTQAQAYLYVKSGSAISDKQDASVTIDKTQLTLVEGETVTAAITTDPASLAVTYTTSADAVAEVSATGLVTAKAQGVATITATWAEQTIGEVVYRAGSKTFTITVVDPNANDGSLEKPYSVAEARAAIDANTGITGVYATGIVSEIVTAYNSQYGNISYNISADGTTSGDQLQAYRGKSYNGENFTSEDDIQVGDVVVVYGNLTKYNSIYEFAQGNQLVSLTRANAIASDIDITPLSVNVEETGTFAATVTVAEGLSDSDYTLSWTSSDENSLIVENGSYIVGDKKGKVTITVTVNPSEALSSQYKPFSKPFVVTIIDPNAGDGSLEKPFTVADVIEYDGTADNVWVKGYIVGSYLNNELTDVTGQDAPASNIALFDNKTGATTANTIPVQLSNNSSVKLLIRNSLNLNANPGVLGEEVLVYGNITSYFGKQGLKDTSDGYIILPEIGSAGYSTTYYSNADLKVQDGTEAYAVTGNTNQLTYTSVGDVIPAGVAVVLKGSGPQKFQIVSAPETTIDFFQYANNNLKGLDVDGQTVGPDDNGSYVYYKLTVENGVVGFYWAEANGAPFNSKAHKAYLVLPASGQVVSSYAFDETVGISSPMLNEIKSEGVYTLSGVRVMSDCLPKGIYIVNGKKMVIK